MAETRRSYRTENRENTTTSEQPRTRGDSNREASRGTAGTTEKPKQTDGEFVSITSLFTSKSGKADTVFVTEDIAAKLKDIRPGDTLGVSTNNKSGRLMMWYIAKG